MESGSGEEPRPRLRETEGARVRESARTSDATPVSLSGDFRWAPCAGSIRGTPSEGPATSAPVRTECSPGDAVNGVTPLAAESALPAGDAPPAAASFSAPSPTARALGAEARGADAAARVRGEGALLAAGAGAVSGDADMLLRANADIFALSIGDSVAESAGDEYAEKGNSALTPVSLGDAERAKRASSGSHWSADAPS